MALLAAESLQFCGCRPATDALRTTVLPRGLLPPRYSGDGRRYLVAELPRAALVSTTEVEGSRLAVLRVMKRPVMALRDRLELTL